MAIKLPGVKKIAQVQQTTHLLNTDTVRRKDSRN